jgi:hypothetical protein
MLQKVNIDKSIVLREKIGHIWKEKDNLKEQTGGG